MQTTKTTRKYRIYPNNTQIALLNKWSGIYKFVWNACLEQRFQAVFKTKEKRVSEKGKEFIHVPNYNQQSAELTSFIDNSDFQFLTEPPKRSIEEIERNLDTAWDRWWKKSTKGVFKKPRFKGKKDFLSSYVQYQHKTKSPVYAVGEKYYFNFTKLGKIQIVYHRELPSIPKSITITKNKANQWFVVFTCEETYNPFSLTGKSVGIDLGVKNSISYVDSSGKAEIVKNPKTFNKYESKLKKLQRKAAKQKKGSGRQKDTFRKIAKVYQQITNVDENKKHNLSINLIKDYDIIKMEDLKVSNMIKSAKGTIEEPGKNVKQKAGLNREISRSGFYKFKTMVEYKSKKHNKILELVDPKYTSQTCSKCGYVDKENRTTQASFECLKCGHKEHADVNAARNILNKSTKRS